MPQTAMIIFIVLTSLGILAALSTVFIDYREWIARFFRDKPHLAYMEVFNGKGYELVKGGRVASDIAGDIFEYRMEGKTYEVRAGVKYPVRYLKQRRLIKCKPGQLIALPLGDDLHGYDAKGEPYEPQFTEAEIGLQTYGYALTELNKSIRGKGAGGLLMWFLVIVIVALIGFGAYYYTSHKPKATPGLTGTPTPGAVATPTPGATPPAITISTPTPGVNNGQ